MNAILVIDIPDKYSDRDIYVLHEIYTYEGNRYERIDEYKEGVHKLKPLPEKLKQIEYNKNILDYDEDYELANSYYIDGWNECLDKILGEKE